MTALVHCGLHHLPLAVKVGVLILDGFVVLGLICVSVAMVRDHAR